MSNVLRVYANPFAFAAVKDDGSVVTWGLATAGGDSSSVRLQLSTGVCTIFSTRSAFAALKEDGSVVTWGNAQSGGGPPPCTGAVQSISATDAAFAALTRNFGVHAWGDPAAGGHPHEVSADLAGGVLAVFGCKCAFAAIKHDGSVICWGAAVARQGFDSVRCKFGNMQVRHIASTSNAFAALMAGGSVICWGDPACGGDSSGVHEHLQDDIVKIYSNEVAFAAVKRGGVVVPWGGHYLDLDLCSTGQRLDGVEQVAATRLAFAGLKSDGTVVTWGHRNRGGDSSGVARQLREVRKVCASDNAFAAVTVSGAVVTWGVKDEGGNYCSADELLESDVHDVHSTCNAFVAIKYDGSVVAWGGRRFGGHVPASAGLHICSGDEKRDRVQSLHVSPNADSSRQSANPRKCRAIRLCWMVKLPPKGKVPERFRACSTHLAWLAAEKEVQELEKQCAAQQELESKLKLMRNRLKAMRQGSSARLDAVMQMIEHRKAELLLVKEKLGQLEARKDEPPKYPALTNAQPLGLALTQAVKEMRKRTLSRKREEPNPLSLKQPAAWPSLYSIADLWLAKAELEHALAWRLDASDKTRPKRYVQSPELLFRAMVLAQSLDSDPSCQPPRLPNHHKQPMWRSTLCPPAWADADCASLRMGGVMDAFQHHLFPFGQMVTLRLYQSVFRFERDGQAASSDILRRTGEQLEALRQLACLVNYQRCWSRGRAQSWRRGVQSLCRTLLTHQLSAKLLPGLCASLVNKGPVRHGRDRLKAVLGLQDGLKMLAEAALPSSLGLSPQNDRKARLDDSKIIRELLQLLEQDRQTVRSFKGQASRSEELLQHLTSRGLGLLEHLDQFAQHYPAEILQMPFQLLYSASLSPVGTCQHDRSPRLIPPPEARWFRTKVDGTRYYSPWPSSIDLLFRWATAGGRPSNWVLNLGSGDGSCAGGDEYDPANCLVLNHGWRGIFIEADKALAEQARVSLGDQVRVLSTSVTPSDVGPLVASAVQSLFANMSGKTWLDVNAPRRPDLLKVDVDQADCEFLEALLEIFEPLLLHVEINPLFPPPYEYQEQWRGKDFALPVETDHHLIGCSLQSFIERTRRRWGARARPEAYRLSHVEFENAVLIHPDAARILPESPVNEQSSQQILDLYTAGYFCHPLRGILSMRESLAFYDFRQWMDLEQHPRVRGERMRRFLRREWAKPSLSAAGSKDARYTLSWPGGEALPEGKELDSALDTANELIRLSSPGVVHETLRREALIQRDIAAGLRLMRDRMCLVIDSLGPMVRALGVQEMKHCEQTLELKKLLLAIAQEESVWGMQHKAQASAEGRPIKHLNSETYKLRRTLHKICYAPPGSAVEEDMDAVWKAVKKKEVFDLASARAEAERLRLKVAGCELTMRRSDVKQNALAVTTDNDARACLQTVQAKVKEATDVLNAYAEWASKTEASLILCGLTSPPSAGALEAVPANPMTLEAQRLRKALQGIIEAALITRKRPGRNGGKAGSPTSAPLAEEPNAQPGDEAAKRHSAPAVSEYNSDGGDRQYCTTDIVIHRESTRRLVWHEHKGSGWPVSSLLRFGLWWAIYWYVAGLQYRLAFQWLSRCCAVVPDGFKSRSFAFRGSPVRTWEPTARSWRLVATNISRGTSTVCKVLTKDGRSESVQHMVLKEMTKLSSRPWQPTRWPFPCAIMLQAEGKRSVGSRHDVSRLLGVETLTWTMPSVSGDDRTFPNITTDMIIEVRHYAAGVRSTCKKGKEFHIRATIVGRIVLQKPACFDLAPSAADLGPAKSHANSSNLFGLPHLAAALPVVASAKPLEAQAKVSKIAAPGKMRAALLLEVIHFALAGDAVIDFTSATSAYVIRPGWSFKVEVFGSNFDYINDKILLVPTGIACGDPATPPRGKYSTVADYYSLVCDGQSSAAGRLVCEDLSVYQAGTYTICVCDATAMHRPGPPSSGVPAAGNSTADDGSAVTTTTMTSTSTATSLPCITAERFWLGSDSTGTVTVNGPRNEGTLTERAGTPFRLILQGTSLSSRDRIRITDGSTDCFDLGASKPMHPAVATDFPYEDPSGQRRSGSASQEIWENIGVTVPGTYQVCWCSAGGTVSNSCSDDQEFTTNVATLAVGGPTAGVIQSFACITGVACTLEMTGSGLNNNDRIIIIADHLECGFAPQSSAVVSGGDFASPRTSGSDTLSRFGGIIMGRHGDFKACWCGSYDEIQCPTCCTQMEEYTVYAGNVTSGGPNQGQIDRPPIGVPFAYTITGWGMSSNDRIRIVDQSVRCGRAGAETHSLGIEASTVPNGPPTYTEGSDPANRTSASWTDIVAREMRSYRVCWCAHFFMGCIDGAHFALDIGIINPRGASNSTYINAIPGRPFSLTVTAATGSYLTADDRIRIVRSEVSDGRCGGFGTSEHSPAVAALACWPTCIDSPVWGAPEMGPDNESQSWDPVLIMESGTYNICWCNSGQGGCDSDEDFSFRAGMIMANGVNIGEHWHCAAYFPCTVEIQMSDGLASGDYLQLVAAAPGARCGVDGRAAATSFTRGTRISGYEGRDTTGQDVVLFEFGSPQAPGIYLACYCQGSICRTSSVTDLDFFQQAGQVTVMGLQGRDDYHKCYLRGACRLNIRGAGLDVQDAVMLLDPMDNCGQTGSPVSFSLDGPRFFTAGGDRLFIGNLTSTSNEGLESWTFDLGTPIRTGRHRLCYCSRHRASSGMCENRADFDQAAGELFVRGSEFNSELRCEQGESCQITARGAQFDALDRMVLLKDGVGHYCGMVNAGQYPSWAVAMTPENIQPDAIIPDLWAATWIISSVREPGTYRICYCAYIIGTFEGSRCGCCSQMEEVLALTNEFREQENLPRLELHEALSAVARKHALAMADHCQPFSHEGATERFQDSGLLCHNFAENLAVSKGYAREVMAKATVDGWIASPGHRKNLLGPFNVCGIGWSSNDDCQLYITQLLAYVDLETEPTALSSQVLDAAMQLMDSTPAVCAFTGMALAGPAGLLAGCILGGTARVQWGIRPSSIPLALAARARREVCPARCSLCGASGRLLLSSDRGTLCVEPGQSTPYERYRHELGTVRVTGSILAVRQVGVTPGYWQPKLPAAKYAVSVEVDVLNTFMKYTCVATTRPAPDNFIPRKSDLENCTKDVEELNDRQRFFPRCWGIGTTVETVIDMGPNLVHVPTHIPDITLESSTEMHVWCYGRDLCSNDRCVMPADNVGLAVPITGGLVSYSTNWAATVSTPFALRVPLASDFDIGDPWPRMKIITHDSACDSTQLHRSVMGITCLESGVGMCEPAPISTLSSGSWGSGRELIWTGVAVTRADRFTVCYCDRHYASTCVGWISIGTLQVSGPQNAGNMRFVVNPGVPGTVTINGIGLATEDRIRIIPQNVGCMVVSMPTTTTPSTRRLQAGIDFRSGSALSANGSHEEWEVLISVEGTYNVCWCGGTESSCSEADDYTVYLGTLSVATKRDCERVDALAGRCAWFQAFCSRHMVFGYAIYYFLIQALNTCSGAFGKELLRRHVQISSSAEIEVTQHVRLPTAGPAARSIGGKPSKCTESLESSYQCQGTPGYDQSCIFRCAYLAPGDDKQWVVTLLLLEDGRTQDPAISDWDMPAIRVDNPVSVRVKRFSSATELESHARNMTVNYRPGLSVLFRALWQDRWAHALFDGLYPAFVSLARFGLENHVFTPVAIMSNYTAGLDCRKLESQALGLSGAGIYTGTACQMEEAFRLFGGRGKAKQELLRLSDLWEQLLNAKAALLFDHLVSGSAHMGEYASYVSLPGTKDSSLAEEPSAYGRDIVGEFADRLYLAHGLDAPSSKTSSRPAKQTLKVIITANKRMTPEEVTSMKELAQQGVASLRNFSMDVSFVDWSLVQPFRKQLELLQNTDIMVTGIGTAMFYSTLLPFGSVCINTGWKDSSSMPTYGEEVLGMSNHRSKFLYMPLDRLRDGMVKADIEHQIQLAASLITDGFSLPLRSSEENLSIFGRIIHELGQQSDTSRKGLQGREQLDGGFLCHQRPTGQTSLSDLVFERMVDARNLLFQLPGPMQLAEACQIDLEKLRQLKKKYQLLEALGTSDASCECVVCESCGLLT
ncbi:hypothetical protein AK812_SmicGene33593 [Symbiodinium microadriaticum]|uniref:SCP domain-containing protein n=1 Tax=Symbiodinium microadriaticum TaxID=2951 RepID=A0A1Q9CR62_SYMMI|nr:hypothetical protein AK812_SmicGene33593 [Symbiodinium microadriaticum]